MNTSYLDTPIGCLRMQEQGGSLLSLTRVKNKGQTIGKSKLLAALKMDLKKYFSGQEVDFSIYSLPEVATDFQKKVWQALRQIPYGETQTYGDIAKRVGRPKAFRAVGSACGANPQFIITPCHRVIGANGKLGGFAGGIPMKKSLLSLEKSN